jgi:hypothetical protein
MDGSQESERRNRSRELPIASQLYLPELIAIPLG